MALTALRRRTAALAGLLAVALVAGPAASAACAHLGETLPATHEVAGHGMDHGDAMEPEGPAPEMPPCHEAPPPADDAPASHDCASACCATDAPSPVPPAPVLASAGDLAPVAVEVTGPEAVAPVADLPSHPPPRPTRLHVEIGRFLI